MIASHKASVFPATYFGSRVRLLETQMQAAEPSVYTAAALR